jgi:hypothetical protein
MKKNKIIYWITTTLLFLFEGVMPALTSQSKMAKDGIAHLGYPQYFGVTLTVFKVIGALVLIIPAIPKRFKEWAYACFGVEFIFAFVSNVVIDGFGGDAVAPLIVFAVLIVSYVYYHKVYSVEL